MPVVSAGNFAYVFKLANGNVSKAVRCFSRQLVGRQERYEALDAHLDVVRVPAIVGFDYDAAGIRVNGVAYPTLVMEWLNGDALDVYLGQVVSKPAVLAYLADKWLALIAQLDAAKMAHGDLQHGNIIVCSGELRLVDLDGMFVPTLQGRRAIELGHIAYQHPARTEEMFDETIDRFSALAIYVSLKALAARPSLWAKYHDENLIFTRQDYREPWNSSAFKECREIGGEVKVLTEALMRACVGAPQDVPSLSAFGVTKSSKLPAWMQDVPPGGIYTATKTREAGVGPKVTEPAAPSYVATPSVSVGGSGPGWSVPPAGSHPPLAGRAGVQPAAPGWWTRFAATTWRVSTRLWWVILLSLFSQNGETIFFWSALVVGVGVICGVFIATAGTSSPVPTPVAPVSPSYTTIPRPLSKPSPTTWSPPTSASGSGTSAVVASRIRSIYHRPTCEWAYKIKSRNRIGFSSGAEAQRAGYKRCRVCSP